MTTVPAPTSAHRPIRTPGSTTEREPIAAPYSTVAPTHSQSDADLSDPSGLMARGKRSFVNTTSGPTKTPSSSVVPSYTHE